MKPTVKKILSVFIITGCYVQISLCALAQNDVLEERNIHVDYSKTSGKLSRMYAECIGAGRANEGLRADWQQQLLLIQKEIGFKYIRFHGLLSDDMHVYTEDKEGNPLYNFQYVDKLYDYLLSIGIRPFVELSFMPPDLASGTKTIFWWKGNVSPPKSYEKWEALIHALVKHFEERYGRAEVEKWYFEVWNEPDLGGFLSGTMDDYFKLYETSVKAIKAVSSTYKVGGPASARNNWIKPFLQFCADKNVAVDFVSTHTYNTKSVLDEFGVGKRRLVAADYLSNAIKKSRQIIDSTVYKNLALHYTEFNSSPSSRDPIHDTYQNAAWLLNTLKRAGNTPNSMSYWAFTDIFEEAGPAMMPFHGGFGLLNLQGIKKPTFYAYKFLSELGETVLMNADSTSWACKNKNGLQVLFWNMSLPFNDSVFNEVYFKKQLPAADAGNVKLQIDHVPNGRYEVQLYKVGYQNNDAYTAYLEMGAPANISLSQEAALKKTSSGDAIEKKIITIADGRYNRDFLVKQNDIYFIKLVKI